MAPRRFGYDSHMTTDPRSSVGPNATPADPNPSRKIVRKAIGPRLRIVFNVMLVLLALIGANSAYLVGVKVLEWWTTQTYQDYFYICMFLMHIVVGVLIVVPFLVFGLVHMRNTKDRKIRRTVNIGYTLFAICIVILISGFALVRIEGLLDLKHPTARTAMYWAHVACPIVGLWLYWLHRLVGPKMRWKQGLGYGGLAAVAALTMIALQSQDPRQWDAVGPAEGAEYFEPSLTRTATGNFIPAKTLDMNGYCLKCHQDSHKEWEDSVHHFSSFNNPTYLASVAETREVGMERDGTVKASRFCAGCHDPVPFFSGAFDDPKFDMLNHPTAKAGITCTVCHAITHVNSNVGNADFTIEEPQHYPFAHSQSSLLQWVNNQLVKAKPSFHKKTFLKPLHATSEFCSTCHKVNLPFELNHYRDWLRGQNHYDSWLLSGVSGHGARSFYYPPEAQTNCNECHMPTHESTDFGAKVVDESGQLKIHNHMFPSANTGMAWLRGRDDVVKAHQEYMNGVMRVDIFGIREGGTIDGELTAPLRPQMPTLQPGHSYLLESVIRTVKMGHHFTQGTTDSNEIWLEVVASSGERRIGVSGLLQDDNSVDPWAHFVNSFMLDKLGNRIDRRNAQDIFVPLYSNQIPPGAGQTVHYAFAVPDDVAATVTVKVRLLYRKFDATYMQYVDEKLTKLGADPLRGHTAGQAYRNELPITVLAEDSVTFGVTGVAEEANNADRDIPAWQRWNDYGIGMLLTGKAQLKQAAEAFQEVEKLERYDGPLNLARVLLREAGSGQLNEAVSAIGRAAEYTDPPAPPWTLAWLSGELNRQQGFLQEAEENFRQVLGYHTAETERRKFDFSRDYVVNNLLGQTIFDRALQIRGESRKAERDARMQEAVAVFECTLLLDSENVDAHYNLSQLYSNLGDRELADKHQKLHAKYKPDDTARGQAVGAARRKYPAANAAAEPLVIYQLK
jgi:tetratricopeptide (TPR) repeat protein/heme/copper-type cytochrome/quinol oxidase subunit 2